MTATPLPALPSGDPSTWDQALYAFLVEKGNRAVYTKEAAAATVTLDMVDATHGFLLVPANGSPSTNELLITSDGGATWTTLRAAWAGAGSP